MRGCHLGKTLYFQNFMCMETKYVYHILCICIMYYLTVLHVYLTIFYVFFLIKYKKKTRTGNVINMTTTTI